MDFEGCSSRQNLPQDLLAKAEEVSSHLLPDISRERYEKEYKHFSDWCSEQHIKPSQVSDEVLLVFLAEKSNSVKPSTLWSRYSMIKSVLKIRENVDVSNFPKTNAFLKKQSIGFQPKKATVFTNTEITQFMIQAPNETWLLSKVIFIFGIFGACRRDDLLKLKVNDVKDSGTFITVFLRGGKTHINRSFTIIDEDCSFKPCQLVRKYFNLRPPHMKSDRFFVGYRAGKCVAQNVGGHSIAGVPKKVALYLNLDHPETYTGHSIRRTSASMLVEGGADLLTLKRHGGWRSSAVAESYIEDSVTRKIDVSKKLFSKVTATVTSTGTTEPTGSTAMKQVHHVKDLKSSDRYFTVDNIFEDEDSMGDTNNGNTTLNLLQTKVPGMKALNISRNENCTFHIHFDK